MNSGLEGKEIVCPKWGWDKRKILLLVGPEVATTKSQKEGETSGAGLPGGRSLCQLGDGRLENHQRALRSGVSHAQGDIPDADNPGAFP